jgi:hypothetical protein
MGASRGPGRFHRRGSGLARRRVEDPMTTPGFLSGSDSNRTMAFVMPARHGVNSIDNPCQGGHGSVDGVQTSSRVYPT